MVMFLMSMMVTMMMMMMPMLAVSIDFALGYRICDVRQRVGLFHGASLPGGPVQIGDEVLDGLVDGTNHLRGGRFVRIAHDERVGPLSESGDCVVKRRERVFDAFVRFNFIRILSAVATDERLNGDDAFEDD